MNQCQFDNKNMMADLLVIGAGQLGRLVANAWKSSHPKSTVTLKFRSFNSERKQALESEGFCVISMDQNWDKKITESCFVFTSSGSVFAENAGGEVDETSEVVKTVRSEKLVDGEDAVLAHGGCVLRLGGLYPYSRETMAFYSKKGAEIARPRGLINQVRINQIFSKCEFTHTRFIMKMLQLRR